MKAQEQKSVDELVELVSTIKKENNDFKIEIMGLVNSINTKVDTKDVPISLEQSILSTVQKSMQAAIEKSLTDYGSPLLKLITIVVDEHSRQLKQIISDSFDEVIQKDEFKKSVQEGFSHKITRTLMSDNNSLLEKTTNELKRDPIFKAKISLAIDNVINEYLNGEKNNEEI